MYVWFRNRTTACSMFQTTITNCQQIQFTPSYLATDPMQMAHEPAGSCFTTFPTTFTSNTSDRQTEGEQAGSNWTGTNETFNDGTGAAVKSGCG